MDDRHTLSGKLSALGCLEKASFLERGVPSLERLKPTRLAAEDIQLPLARALAEEDNGVEEALLELEVLGLTCLLEETVGDMKCGVLVPSKSSIGGVTEAVARRLPVLLAFIVISDSFPILSW